MHRHLTTAHGKQTRRLNWATRWLAPYRIVLAAPGVGRAAAAALGWTIGAAMLPLATVLSISQSTGSLASGGAVLAALTLGAGLGTPLTSRWVDGAGAAHPVAALGLLQGLAVAAIAAAAWTGAPTIVAMVAALVAGGIRPPILPALRSLIAKSLQQDSHRRSGYGMLGTLEELALVIGPALAGVAAAIVAPTASLLIAAVVVTCAAQIYASAPGQLSASPTPERRAPLRDVAVWMLMAMAICCGICFGAIDVAAAANAGVVAGAMLAALSLGIGLSSFIFGLRPPGGSAINLLAPACLAAALALSSLTLGLSPATMVAAMLISGLALSPVLNLQWAAMDELDLEGSATEVAGLSFAAFTIGAPAGALVSGALAEASGTEVAFGLAAASLAAAAVAALVLRVYVAIGSHRGSQPAGL